LARGAGLRLATVSVVDALIESLRSRVLDGALAPGSSLAETEIAGEYGVSRPTARSAVTALVHEGLLHREANKPATVPRLTRADVDDVYLVRTPVEIESIRLLVARDTVPVREADRAVCDLDDLAEDAPHSAFVEADLRFHRTLVDAVGSPRLSRLYRTIDGEVRLCMAQSRHQLGTDRIAAEHRGVLDALRDRDEERAALRMRAHLDGARRSLQGVVGED
jgi:DNA-binding GntR family transcriptional regulator